MPTYEYACSACHHEWEFEQSIKDAALTECPSCHQPTAKRQISRGTGFILKGSGWYADAYSSASNKPAAADKPAEGKATEAKKDDGGSKPSGSTGSGSGGTSSEGSGSGGSSSGGAAGSSGSTPAPAGSSTKSPSADAV